MALKRQGKELLADELAQKIKAKIENQEYQQGQRLTVRRLCEEFGTSETPVKQALNQLVSTGLIIAIPKCGMRVRTFDFKDLKNIWEARLMIEEYCAESAVERARVDEEFVSNILRLLEVSNQEHSRCIENFTHENFNCLNIHDEAIHMEIVKCCQNEQIISMYEGLNAHSGMFLGFNSQTPDTLREVMNQHKRIVDALLLCDLDEVRKALRQHIYTTIQVYRNAYFKQDVEKEKAKKIKAGKIKTNEPNRFSGSRP